MALLNLVINDINSGFVSGGFTNGPVSWVGKFRNTSLSEFNTFDLVLDIIHGDFVHTGCVSLSSVDNSSVVSSLALVVICKVVRGLHLEHEVAIHVEWIMSDGEDVFSAQSLDGVAHFLWKDESVVDPSDFDRNLLVIDWVRTTSVAEAKFDSRDVVIQEVLTVSKLQAQDVRVFNTDTALLTSGRVALDVDHSVIRKNGLINSDVHSDKSNQIRNNGAVEVNLELNLGSVIRISEVGTRLSVGTWEVSANESVENEFWNESLEEVELIILGDLTKLNNFVCLRSVLLLELINVLSDQALSIQSLSDWSLSRNQTSDVWIRRYLRQLIKQRVGS